MDSVAVRLTVLVAAAALALPTVAQATFKGTEGKVAYLSEIQTGPLWLWDPGTEQSVSIEPQTYDPQHTSTTPGPNSTQINDMGLPSSPVWSPDGTRFAYSTTIGDLGNIPGFQHTAIFVYDLRDGSKTQISSPDEALWDTDPEHEPVLGHLVGDWSPIWSSDGTKIAFIRHIQAHGPDDALWDQRGQNLWIVNADGGSETQVTHVDQQAGESIQGGVWIPESQDLVVSYMPDGGVPYLGRLSSAGGTPQYLAGGQLGEAITDYDVSPDGTKLAYTVLGFSGVTPFVQPLDGGAVGTPVASGFGAIMRWSGSGDGLLHSDCTTGPTPVCGLLNRVLEDPERDVRADAPDRLALAFDEPVPGGTGLPARSALDIQPQTLPVIFVPGFLGTRIECSGSTLWPRIPPYPDALGMRLEPDGLTNKGCADAHPTEVVDTILLMDIYDGMEDYIEDDLEDDRGTMFGWDWRKKPEPTLAKLDEAIDAALDKPGPWKDQQVERVTLMGHSYGGLLIRSYLEEHPEKVARTLSIGTPYWGAPKSLFPLAFGVESPEGGPGMDYFFKNSELRELARDLGGLYQLLPSQKYRPGWLQVDGVAAGLADWVAELGGNTNLLAEAQSLHNSIYDRFNTIGGRVDVRAVVGTGKATFGELAFAHQENGTVRIGVQWTNGDGTVPGLSGTQGPLGPWPAPPADQIPIQNTCGVDHVAMANDSDVHEAYDDWVRYGGTPRKLPGQCDAQGGSYEFPPGVLGATDPASRRRAGITPMEAEQQGLVDVVDLPNAAMIVTDDRAPVTVTLQVDGATFTFTPITGAGGGAPLTYGPATGTLELGPPAQPGGAPTVTLDGAPLAPHAAPPSPSPSPTPGPGGTVSPTPAPTATPTPPSNRFTVAAKRRKGRRVRLTLRVPGPGRVRVKATVKRKKAGTVTKTAKRAGNLKLALKLRRGVRGRVKLAITYTPTGGKARTLVVRV